MSILILPAIPLLVAFSPGCNVPTDAPTECELLSIVLRSEFQNDSIEVELDNDVIFRGAVTTDSFGVAWQTRDTVSSGAHRVRVFLPDRSARGDTVISVITSEIAFEHFVNVYYDGTENKITMTLFIQRGGISKEEICN